MDENNTLDGKSGIRILLTGERRNGRFLVLVDDQPVWLAYTLYRILTILVQQHVDTSGREFYSNSSAVYPSAVCRLRKAVDQVAGVGAGRELIQTGARAEYRLAPTTSIHVERRTLQPSRLLSASLLDNLPAA